MDISDISLLSAKRINALKCPFATRRVPRTAFATLLGGARRPRVGDLVLARVHQLGQDAHLELACGRLARLFVGDEIVLAYGISQSPDQFEAGMPVELRSCHLVAAGGLAGRVSTRHDDSRPATTIQPIGLLGDRSARALNLAAFALPAPAPSGLRPFTIAVLGAASKAGKTETAAHIIRGLRDAGLRVGAARLSGAASGRELWTLTDAGAEAVLDFTDAGLPSTYGADAATSVGVMHTLLGYLGASGVDATVVELADGLLQRETGALVQSPEFADAVDAVVFAASDAMGSAGGVQWLRALGLPVIAAAGVLTSSPLATREAAAATGLPVLAREQLASAAIAGHLGYCARQALLAAGGA